MKKRKTTAVILLTVNLQLLTFNCIAQTIGAGTKHTLSVCDDNTAMAWGRNGFGRLGDSTTTQRNTPVQVKGEGGVGNLTVTNIK